MSLNLIMGARNGAKNEREQNDFYATHPNAVKHLFGLYGKRIIKVKL